MAFKKGESGNPAGRRPGTTPATKLKKAIVDNMPDILQAMIEQAKEGDTAAAKVLIDKVIPSLKPQALSVKLPDKGSLVEQGGRIIQATMAGHIPPDIGSQLITALASQSKIIEIEELTKRLEVLEKNNEH